MIISNLYIRINNLVSEPDCSTRGDEYNNIAWNDQRTKPTSAELKAVDVDAIIAQKESDAASRKTRDAAVSGIIVTTQSGKSFDGDEISQSRMARAVTSSDPLDETLWKLSDNSISTVTREELKEALNLSGNAQTALWMV